MESTCSFPTRSGLKYVDGSVTEIENMTEMFVCLARKTSEWMTCYRGSFSHRCLNKNDPSSLDMSDLEGVIQPVTIQSSRPEVPSAGLGPGPGQSAQPRRPGRGIDQAGLFHH